MTAGMMEANLTELLTTLSALGPTGSQIGGALIGFTVGVLLGLIHFGSLWWNLRLLASAGALRALAVQLLRFALLAVVLAGLAKLGAAALLAGALGLLLARGLLLRRLGRAPSGPDHLGGAA